LHGNRVADFIIAYLRTHVFECFLNKKIFLAENWDTHTMLGRPHNEPAPASAPSRMDDM
jgi:hypothetical protein